MSAKGVADVRANRGTPRPHSSRKRKYRSASDALDAYVAGWEERHGEISVSCRDICADLVLERVVAVLWELIQETTRPAEEAMTCLRLSNKTMQGVTQDMAMKSAICEHYFGRGSGDDGTFSLNSMSTETLLSLDPFVFCTNCLDARSNAKRMSPERSHWK